MTPYEIGRAAWPRIELTRECYDAHVSGLDADERNAADLYLACACLHHAPHAIETFEQLFLSRLPALTRRLRPSREILDELQGLLREKLFTGAKPRIAEFSGRGTLNAWLRVVAVRAALDLLRHPAHVNETQRSFDAHPAATATPELAALRARYKPLFAAALDGAFASLTTDERNLLRMHLVDGIELADLAPMFRVNRATIFRRYNACTLLLYQTVRDHLAHELSISPSEFDSIANLVRSDLELSLVTLLAASAEPSA